VREPLANIAAEGRQRRESMKTSIAIGALALVAVAGSANAGIVDPFTTAQAGGGAGATWSSIPSSLFAQRRVQRFNNSTASVGSGAWSFAFTNTNGTANLAYRQDSGGSTIDLSGISSMSFDITVTGTVSLNWYLEDNNGPLNLIQAGAPVILTGTSTQTLNFSTATIDPGFDLSAVTGMTIVISSDSSSASATVSNFTYTLVPTPGAVALLGMGGLLAARRRR
jgi:hypothetical protein